MKSRLALQNKNGANFTSVVPIIPQQDAAAEYVDYAVAPNPAGSKEMLQSSSSQLGVSTLMNANNM